MSRFFGPIRQVGYVVRDARKAMAHWAGVCGVGPWFFSDQMAYSGFKYKGQSGSLRLAVALANSGDMQMELIQPLDDSPSMFRDFLSSGKEGMHHWCVWPENYQACLDTGVALKLQIGQEIDSPRGRAVFFLNEDHPGSVIEVSESTPGRIQTYNAVRAASQNWNGEDPIRMGFPK